MDPLIHQLKVPQGTSVLLKDRIMKDCRYCGGEHNRGNCPAYGKECRKCLKRNHFSKVCNSRKSVKAIEKNDSREDINDNFFIDVITINNYEVPMKANDNKLSIIEKIGINTVQSQAKDEFGVNNNEVMSFNLSAEWTQMIEVNGKNIDFKIDTGSQVDIIRHKDYIKLEPKPELFKTGVTLNVYNNTVVPIHGKCVCDVKYGNMKVPIWFIVTEDNLPPVVGLQTSEKLSLIKRIVNNIKSRSGIEVSYQDCFGEIGCLSHTYHIELNDNAKPVVSPSRRIPHSLKPKVKMELDRMLEMNIIEQVERPTDWVNALVVVEKPNGKLRLCLDPRPLNQAIKRHYFPMPTAEDIFSSMQGA